MIKCIILLSCSLKQGVVTVSAEEGSEGLHKSWKKTRWVNGQIVKWSGKTIVFLPFCGVSSKHGVNRMADVILIWQTTNLFATLGVGIHGDALCCVCTIKEGFVWIGKAAVTSYFLSRSEEWQSGFTFIEKCDRGVWTNHQCV